MSIFSGKCDFYDSFCMIGSDGDEKKIEEKLKNLTLSVYGKDDRPHVVKSDTIKDITKYYPYLTVLRCGNKIVLSSDSFIDIEEAERIQWRVDDVLKYWRKCKRNKIKFNEKECIEALSFWKCDKVLKEIIHRVANDGDKAVFDDLHLAMHEYYRKMWYEEMVKVGWSEDEAFCWVYKELFPTPEALKRLNTDW